MVRLGFFDSQMRPCFPGSFVKGHPHILGFSTPSERMKITIYEKPVTPH